MLPGHALTLGALFVLKTKHMWTSYLLDCRLHQGVSSLAIAEGQSMTMLTALLASIQLTIIEVPFR